MKRGDVYIVDLGRGVGREAAGVRSVVVVSDQNLNQLMWTVVVLPGFEPSAAIPFRNRQVLVTAAESGLPSDLVFTSFQLRSLDYGRFPAAPVGRVLRDRMNELFSLVVPLLNW